MIGTEKTGKSASTKALSIEILSSPNNSAEWIERGKELQTDLSHS